VPICKTNKARKGKQTKKETNKKEKSV